MPAQSRSIAGQQCPSVRVLTLGRFRVEVKNAPLRFGRKAQRKPLDLLKVLIAYGGEGVCAEQIAEDLWPDSDGDLALAALRTTVSRLRKLIGAGAVRIEGHSLTLNPEVCWADALAFGQQIAEFTPGYRDGCGDEALVRLEEATSLYRGEFLPGECDLPPVLSARTKLHSLFLRHLTELGRRHEQAGQFGRAIDLYRRGLEIDEAAEGIARRLMECCRNSGRAAEGIAAYRNCQATLRARLGVEPSAATQGVYRDLLALTERDAADQRRDPSAIVAPAFGAGPAELSIAVLPFDDLSPAGDHQRLADAIRETIICLLGVLPHLSLVALPRSGPDCSLSPGGGLPRRASAVRYVVQGNVMVVANCLRATVHVIDGRTGQYAWSEQLDHKLHDLIEARDHIAVEVADRLARKLVRGDFASLLLRPNIHVWKALVQVRVFLNRQTRQGQQRARALLERTLEVDPQEPLIQGLQAITHVIDSWKRWTNNAAASLRIGEQRLRQLQKRYGWDVQALSALPWACALRGDIDEALRLARRRVDRLPDHLFSHAYLGIPLMYQGRYAEAQDKLDDAVRVSPRPLHWLYKDRAVAQFCVGRHDEAASDLASVLRDPLQRDNDLLNTRMMYIANLAAGGRADLARHEAKETLAAHPAVSTHQWCEWHFQPYRDKSPARRIEGLLAASGLPQ